MTQESLKTIFTFDEQTKTFNPAAHNLTPQKAVEKAGELENKGLKTKILDQPSRHTGRGHKRCEPCRTAAENLSQKPPEDSVPGESPEDEEAHTQSEGD